MGTTWDYKTASDCGGQRFSIIWAPGPWLRMWAYWCPGAGTAQSWAGTVTEAGKEPWAPGTVRVCSAPAPGAQEGSWTLQGRGICERMRLHLCCSRRMVLEAWLLLSLRTSVLLNSQDYLPVGILKHLFFFKWSDNLKIWWSQRIFKWTFNGCQLFNF